MPTYTNGNRSLEEAISYKKEKVVHRCGSGGSMRASHAEGPGSIPGRDKFPG